MESGTDGLELTNVEAQPHGANSGSRKDGHCDCGWTIRNATLGGKGGRRPKKKNKTIHQYDQLIEYKGRVNHNQKAIIIYVANRHSQLLCKPTT